MQNLTETIQTLTAMLTPAAMITACSLFLLGVYDKYSKIVASIRALNNESRHNTGADGFGSLLPEQEQRERQIHAETRMLHRRLVIVLTEVQSIVAATGAFITAALLIGIGLVFHWNTGILIAIAVTIGLVFLLVAMTRTLREIQLIGDVVASELRLAPDNRKAARSHSPIKTQG